MSGLKCYTDIEGKQITTCKETEGYRTCFTKYNDSKLYCPYRTTVKKQELVSQRQQPEGGKREIEGRPWKILSHDRKIQLVFPLWLLLLCVAEPAAGGGIHSEILWEGGEGHK